VFDHAVDADRVDALFVRRVLAQRPRAVRARNGVQSRVLCKPCLTIPDGLYDATIQICLLRQITSNKPLLIGTYELRRNGTRKSPYRRSRAVCPGQPRSTAGVHHSVVPGQLERANTALPDLPKPSGIFFVAVSLVFGIYAVAVLGALLWQAGMSDYVGVVPS